MLDDKMFNQTKVLHNSILMLKNIKRPKMHLK